MNSSVKIIGKRFGLALLLLAMVFTTIPFAPWGESAVISHAGDSDKTLTVDASAPVVEGESYQDIQSAIIYIREKGPKDQIARATTDGPEDGWTITVKAGTYDAFVLIRGVDNCTIKTTENAVIKVYDGHDYGKELIYASDGTAINWYDYVSFGQAGICQHIQVDSKNATIDGFTITVSDKLTSGDGHYPIIGNQSYNEGWFLDGLVVKNCTIDGSGTSADTILVGIKLDSGATDATVQDCTLNNIHTGIYFEDYAANPLHFTFKDNTFAGGNMAVHGGHNYNANKSPLAGTITITGNTLTGTSDLRNKIVLAEGADQGSTLVTVSGNTLENALIGLINLDGGNDNLDDYTGDALADNTYGDNSFYVRGNEPGTLDYYATFLAPEGKKGHWYLRDGDISDPWYDITEPQKELIQQEIDRTNALEDNRVLSVSIADPETGQPIHTFTWWKNIIYWEDDAVGDLEVKKTIAGDASSEEDEFTFTATLTVDGEPMEGTAAYGDMTFENGVATFKLKGGESVKATGIPAGTAYEVAETDAAGYEMTAPDNAAGTIVEDETITVSFTNTKNAEPEPEPEPEPESDNGNLEVKKIIVGDAASAEDEFTFTVTLSVDGTPLEGTVNYGDMTFEDGTATFKLKGGESIKATEIPAGTEYTVTEIDKGDFNLTSSENTSGTIAKDETATASFTNTKNSEPDKPKKPDKPKDPSEPDSPKKKTPGTGDKTDMANYLILLFVSAGVLATIGYRHRRTK